MKCQFCNQELPEGARFCLKCKRQIVCLECGSPIFENSSICVYCGRTIVSRTINDMNNYIRYTESKDGKSFEASFSDETAGHVASFFSGFVSGNSKNLINTPQIQEVPTFEDYVEEQQIVGKKNTSSKNEQLIDRIFGEKDGAVFLSEKRLKASNKTDYQCRASMLFLLYNKKNGNKEVSKEILYSFMKSEKIYDGTYRAWLSRHSSYFIATDNSIELTQEGLEIAENFLKEIFDDTIEVNWRPNVGSKMPIRTNTKRFRPSQVSELKELDLNPLEKESLEDFISRFKIRKSSSQYNLLFVYYLTKVLEISGVNQNHIYTCYRRLGVRLPNDLYHSLSDNISKNHWMNNINDLTLTSSGINFVEHTMKKK